MAMYTEADKRGKMGREPNGQADYFRFMLRLPPDMARKIDALAKVDYSPVNAYILRILRDHLKSRGDEVDEALRLTAAAAVETAPAKRTRRVS